MVRNFKSCILNACTTCPLILFFLLRFFVFYSPVPWFRAKGDNGVSEIQVVSLLSFCVRQSLFPTQPMWSDLNCSVKK